MEMKLMLPAGYNVLTEEEMTYTEGGANVVDAFVACVIPIYGWYKGVTAVRDYRKKNPTTWTSTGADALTRYMNKSTTNALYGGGCTFWMVGSCFTGVGLLINALIILT